MGIIGTRKKKSQFMTTLEMEIALMEHYDVRANIIVPNIGWAFEHLHECDLLLLRKSNVATEIEIKVSKADLKKDKDKKHTHTHPLISKFYFAVPKELEDFALEYIPEKAGLITVERYKKTQYTEAKGYYEIDSHHVRIVKSATVYKQATKWTEEQKYKLARLGAMRILTLKKNIFKLK